ncbi:hypothetical protein M0805_005388 [Coniferiporia weirii]|nr:hypothetical protein M0805_005388 [Coniferiporia weirii]
MSTERLASASVAAGEDVTKEAVQANQAARIAWLVLNIWPSHLGLPVLIATILLAKHIRRHATFVNMCITWMIVGFSSSLLLYAGFQTGPEPPRLLCLIQASLLYGQPGLTSMSAFALVFQVFYVVRAAFREKDPEYHRTRRKWALLILPYIAFTVFVGWTAYVGLKNPELVSRERRFFYCSVKYSLLTNSITSFSFCVLLITMGLELWITYTVYKHWRVMRANGLGERTGTDLNLVIRTAAFALWIFLGMGLSALSIKAPQSPVPDMALATMGSGVVLVFGTQRDVLRAWMFWNRDADDSRRVQHPGISSADTLNLPALASTTKRTNSPSWSEKPESPQESEHQDLYFPHKTRTAAALRAFSRRRTPSSLACSSRRALSGAASILAESSSNSPLPSPTGSSDPKISRIVDDISGLTLLQAADLVTMLKSRLNIQEIAMPAASVAPVAAASTLVEDAPVEEKPKEKTIFNVKLESFDAAAKPKIIREVKAMNPTLTLVAAKNFVESLPKLLKENLPKDEAEKMKKAFEALGGVVTLD